MAAKRYIFTVNEVASLLQMVGKAIDPSKVADPGLKALIYKCQDMRNIPEGVRYILTILPPD